MSAELDTNILEKRLNVVILLLLEMTPGGADTTTRKIERLLGYGLSQTEVAAIIGKKLNYVGAVVSGKKKSASKRAGRA
jgi:hypothetical protein